jgi:hypothetical protein
LSTPSLAPGTDDERDATRRNDAIVSAAASRKQGPRRNTGGSFQSHAAEPTGSVATVVLALLDENWLGLRWPCHRYSTPPRTPAEESAA